MASVTLGQHPARHHLDSEKLFFRKLQKEGKKLMRKPSGEKMTRESAADAAAATGEAAHRAPLTQQPSLDTVNGTALEMHDSTDAGPPRSADRTAYTVPAAQTAPECPCSLAIGGIIITGYPWRSSTKNTHEVPPRVKFRALSVDGDTLEGIQLARLTQGRRGVVKLIRTGQPRRQAWSIFDQDEPSVKGVRGEGHLFALRRVTQDWCDACNRLIKSTALQCEYCSYTCHLDCENYVRLDCNQGKRQKDETPTASPCRTYSTAPPAKVKASTFPVAFFLFKMFFKNSP